MILRPRGLVNHTVINLRKIMTESILKKITLVIAALAVISGLALIYTEHQNGDEKLLGVILIVFVGIAALSGLIYLVGLTVMGKIWALRLSIVLSVGWLLFSVIVTEPYENYGSITDFILLGVVPLICIWGVIWVAKGLSISKT